MKFAAFLVLVLFLNTVQCKDLSTSARSRQKRQNFLENIANFFGSLFLPNGGTATGGGNQQPSGGGYQQPSGGWGNGGWNNGGWGNGGWWNGGAGTGGVGTGTGTAGSQCSCSQIRNRRDVDESEDEAKNVEGVGKDFGDADLARVVGGQAATAGQYPSIVMVQYDGSQHCGGTIINSMYILTAAHCVKGRSDASRFTVIAGAYNMQQREPGRISASVDSITYHPEYDTGGRYNKDVAIMKLSSPLQFNDRIQPACLPKVKRQMDGLSAIVAGWGKTSESGGTSSVLQNVMVPIMNTDRCSAMMDNKYSITENMICAGYQQGGRDSCAGDSGGPLFLPGSQGNLQVGVVSFGEGCARASRPGVYAKVDQLMGFITANSALSQGCSFYSM